MQYQGPLPPSAEFAKYETTLPGAADRILKMAEQQSTHRQEIEKMAIVGEIKNSSRGQICAVLIVITAIICGSFLVYAGKSVQGLATIITAIAGIAGTFIYGTRSKRKEREHKYFNR
jgi:uncharacterized membrane protein